MTVSVALCTYNGEQYLGKQLESILNQTMPVDEVVIGDDGSQDTTLDIADSFKDKLPINTLKRSTQIGAIRNFLQTISKCHGEIILLSDQDDIWMPNKVESISNYFKTHSAIEAVFTNAELIDSNGNLLNFGYTLWDYFFDEISRKRCEMGLMIEEFCTRAHATGATMAFRKQLTERFPPREDIWHDEMIARLAVSSHSLAYLPECLTYYRIHDNQQIGISPHKPNDGTKRDYRLPEMPFPIEDTLLTDEEDIKHINFLRFRCALKHQVFGWINAMMHLPSYKKFYRKKSLAFAMYDVHSSIRHTGKRIINKIKPFYGVK